jgi:adenosylcobinamide-GDP ribazoletransferase
MAVRLGLPPLVAAVLALAAGMVVTGCLHEDGLADTADGFGGNGHERRLEIMRDSRLGTYGACALLIGFTFGMRRACEHCRCAAVALCCRGPCGGVRHAGPHGVGSAARSDGLAAQRARRHMRRSRRRRLRRSACARPCRRSAAAAVALVLVAATAVIMARVSVKAIGGHTGDLLGALEQINEILVLLVAAAFARP